MANGSSIDPKMIEAYRETEYRVLGEETFTLKIGVENRSLRLAHQRHGVDCSAFITAFNPFSRPVEEGSNEIRQDQLTSELSSAGFRFMHGVGQHPTNGWPGEASLLVFGLGLEAARTLATRFEQNGFVWSGSKAIPELILLR